MLRLHHAPMACSLASRFALLEAGLPHEIAVVRSGETKSDAFRLINRRGQVPALETDEGVLTESTAILPYIADLAPAARLFPPAGSFARAQGQAWLSFLSSTLHVAITRAMFPPEGCDTDVARSAAMGRLIAAFQDVDAHLDGRDHVLDEFSVCDLYLLVFSLWRGAPVFAGQLPAFPNLDRVQQSLIARPGLMTIVGEDMTARAQA